MRATELKSAGGWTAPRMAFALLAVMFVTWFAYHWGGVDYAVGYATRIRSGAAGSEHRHTARAPSQAGPLAASRELGEPMYGATRRALPAGDAVVVGHVVDATGGGVAGAVVSAELAGVLQASALSDDAGLFELRLAPGRHSMRVHADGYSHSQRDVWAPSHGVRVTLVPASRIGGRVLAAGVPVADVQVRVFNIDGLRGGERSVSTRAEGAFDVDGLAAGSYVLSATGARWRSDEQRLTLGVGERRADVSLEVVAAIPLTATVAVDGVPCHDGRVGVSGPLLSSASVRAGSALLEGLLPGTYRVDVRCDQALGLSEELLVLQEPVERSWDLSRGLSVRGRVETDGGEPLAGASVSVTPSGAPSSLPDVHCISGDTGEFSCGGLAAGEHECTLSTADGGRGERVSVLLGGAVDPWVILRSPGRGSLRVHVRAASNLELARSELLVRRSGGSTLSGQPLGDGVIFDDIELGEYEVLFEPEALGRQRVRLLRHGQVVDVTIERPQGASLSGWVRDERGVPVLDAWVLARPSQSQRPPAHPTPAPVLANDAGGFEIADLIPGSYDLEVAAPSGRVLVAGVRTGDDDVIATLPAHAAVSLHVRAQGAPPSQFRVAYARKGESGVSVVNGSEGFWFSASLAPGSYVFAVSSELGVATRAVEVAAASDLELTINLDPPGTAEVTGASDRVFAARSALDAP